MESWTIIAVPAKGNLASEGEVPPSFILSRVYLLVGSNVIICLFSAYKFLSVKSLETVVLIKTVLELRNLGS